MKHGKRCLKVAEAETEEEIRGREWKFVSEDLFRLMPESIESLLPSHAERVEWILGKLIDVKEQLGDDGEEYSDDEENTTLQEEKQVEENKEEGPASPSNTGSKFNFVRHIRNRSAQQNRPGLTRTSSSPSISITSNSKNADQPMNDPNEESAVLQRSVSANEDTATNKSKASWLKSSTSIRKIFISKDEELPSYLKTKKSEAITMDKLKQEHERKSMFRGVAGVTIGSVILRSISIDAFLIVLLALNIGVCYLIKNRHAFAKKFVKRSVGRRIRFTKQVWGAKFKRQPEYSDEGSSNEDENWATSSRNLLKKIA